MATTCTFWPELQTAINTGITNYNTAHGTSIAAFNYSTFASFSDLVQVWTTEPLCVGGISQLITQIVAAVSVAVPGNSAFHNAILSACTADLDNLNATLRADINSAMLAAFNG